MYEDLNLKKMLLKIQSISYPGPYREPTLRVSGLPYCPLIHTLDYYGDKNLQEFNSNFFFKQGNAIHSLWQDHAAKIIPKNLIGDYVCSKIIEEKNEGNIRTVTRCNRIVKFCSASKALKSPCLHAKTVAKSDCRNHQHYQELEFILGDLTGHTDFLYRDRKKKYHLIDFKTTSTFLFDKPDIAVNYYPSKKYIVQLETYVLLLEKIYKIKISTYTIAYVSRDRAVHTNKKPALRLFTEKVTDTIRNKRKTITNTYIKQHQVAKKWISYSKKKKLTNIDMLWQSRPCHSRSDYIKNMKIAFFDDCPELGPCMSGKLKKQLIKIAKDN